MKMIQKGIYCAGCFWVFVLLLAFMAHGVYDFHSCLKGNYDTPWFDKSWFANPYTNFRLSFGRPSYYITTNAIGDVWVVKQIAYHGKEFWTVDYTIHKETIYEKK